jgi:putative transposase
VKPAQKRAVAHSVRAGCRVSERRACGLASMARSSYRYRRGAADHTVLRRRLRDLAATRVCSGYRRLHVLLRRDGWRVNHTRVSRLSREEGLGMRVTRRKTWASVPRVLPPPATKPLARWSRDVRSDSLADGRRFRVLTRVDTGSRVSPAIAVGSSLTGERVVALFERLTQTVGKPERIAVDNGPECISTALAAWADQNEGQREFSHPGKPTDTACAESCNGHCRAECLDCHWFAELSEARQTIEAWRLDDHTEPRSS